MSTEKEEKMSQGGQVSKLQMQKISVSCNKICIGDCIAVSVKQLQNKFYRACESTVAWIPHLAKV